MKASLVMTEQVWVLLFSVLMILLSLGAAVWLLIAGSGIDIEGIFLLLVCGVVALVFGLAIRLALKG